MVGLGNIRKVVSFDWDWRSLRIGEARVSGAKVRVRSLVSHPMEAGLAYGNPEGLGQFIRRVLREEGISTRRAIVDIPRDQAVLNTLTLPAAKDEELAGLVRFQIVRELPFPVEEAVVDFAAEPRGADGQQRVLVAAVRNDVLEFYRRVFMQAGLKLERIGLRPYANLVALAQAVPDTCAGRTLFVDVGPALTEIDIVVDGRLVFSRAASVSVLPRRAEGAEGDEGEGEPGDQEAGPSAEGSLETDAQRMVKSLLRFGKSELANANWKDPGGWRSMVISYEGKPGQLADKVLVGGGTIPMALRNRKRLGARLLARLIDETDHEPARVLCLGAGPGQIIIEAMQQANHKVLATLVDLSSDAFDYGRELARKAGLQDNVRFVQGDVRDNLEHVLDDPPDVIKMLGICEYLTDESRRCPRWRLRVRPSSSTVSASATARTGSSGASSGFT